VNINLHIERLVLDGVSVEPQQRAELKAAVQTQLSHLLMSEGIGSSLQSHNNFREISGGSILTENLHKPTSFGEQIGDAVYRSIKK